MTALSPSLATDWNASPISTYSFCSSPALYWLPLAKERRLRRWQGKPGATPLSSSRRFPMGALSSSPIESSAASSSVATTAPVVSPRVLSGPEGAEWAGWECKFSGVDGKRVAVPEDYVPESLREWDVEVWGFETLTSEQLKKGQDESELLYRRRARVFPEVGCALDNLSVEVDVQTLTLGEEGIFLRVFPDGSHVMGKKPEGMRCLRMESVLVVPGRDFGDALSTQGTGEGDPTEQSRLRVEYQLENMGDGGRGELAVCLGSTVTVTRERRYRAGFDDGLLYKGGGLDSQNLRSLLRSDCFGEREDALTAAALAGEWLCGPSMWSDVSSPANKEVSSRSPSDAISPEPVLSKRPETFWENSSNGAGAGGGIKCLLMRGGVTLRAGPWLGQSDSKGMRWGTPAVEAWRACSTIPGVGFDEKEALWAVEVGWILGSETRARREVSTTVFDLSTMEVIGAWRGTEERL